MKIEVKNEGGFIILAIDGNIVLEDTSILKEKVEEYIEDEGIKGIVLNCQKVKFIDSSGLGLIVSIYKTLIKRERKFALSCLDSKTMEIFALTKLDKILTLTDSDETAMKS